MMNNGVKAKWRKGYRRGSRKPWRDGTQRADSTPGMHLLVVPTRRGKWYGCASLDYVAGNREGPSRETKAEAQADAIRLGRELAEDTLRAAMEVAKSLGVEVDDD